MSRSSDTGSWGRRKSAGFFPRPSMNALTPIQDGSQDDTNTTLKKKRRPASFFVPSTNASLPDNRSPKDGEMPGSPKTRPRTLLKNSRPTSIFGSLKSIHSTEEEEELVSSPVRDGPYEDGERSNEPFASSRVVLHHGEVQTSGGVFRKKKDYLVLTEKHLIRFKSQSRAVEAFPSIPPSIGRGNSTRHTSMHSGGSMPDLQSVHSNSSAEHHSGVALRQVIAVYRSEDGRPYFSIEIAYLDGESSHASAMTLQLNDPREAELWLSSIHAAAMKARLMDPTPFPPKSIEYVARKLEQDRDYDPEHFRMFKVVQRVSQKATGRSSSDDLVKLGATVRYLVVGVHKVHLVSLPRAAHRGSTASQTELNSREGFGLMNLTSISVKGLDDAFEVTFRPPLRPAVILHLASTASEDIAITIRQATEMLRPEWLEQSFSFLCPRNLEDASYAAMRSEEDYRGFDRTLTAYCASYQIDTSNIRYTVDHDVDDGPQFTLFPPAHSRRPSYTALELLALFRALRYNECFYSISFSGIKLNVLHQLHDHHGSEHVSWTSRTGAPLDLKGMEKKSLLIQELQAIALKNKKLRRMDFSFCLTRKPHDEESGAPDPGCEIAEALFPLCRKQLTNVDWITLNGVELDETDLDYLVDAAAERASHLRALEISRCGLTDRSLQLILNAMLSQDSTLESIDISGNLARLSPSTFQGQIGHFGFIRKLNLSRVHRTSGPEPLVAPETLLNWRLEELSLSETPINAQTTDSIAAYLATPISDTLRIVRMNQCGLTGRDVAVFMRSMARSPGEGRNLHLHVSENRLEKGHDKLVAAVAEGLTPSRLTMKMVEYRKEDHFREFIQALRRNTTLKYLDLSKASLPYDANEDTCEALQLMFAENKTLEELDISGEHAHLEVAKFGIGLNHALTGLKKNTALKVLRIEYQKLGLQGANTLSSVLEENITLREIYCENNDINLQGLTVLINALSTNTSVCYLPSMDRDRLESLRTVEREIQGLRSEQTGPGSSNSSSGGAASGTNASSLKPRSMRRSLASVKGVGSSRPAPALQSQVYSESDTQAALRLVNDKWDRQTTRLSQYLLRNYQLANGIDVVWEEDLAADRRPSTSGSLSAFLEKVSMLTASSTGTTTIDEGLVDGEKHGLLEGEEGAVDRIVEEKI
ncbi:MAG: GID complex subunit containing RING finger motif [Chaenotheca gracillima]|nr:MAG: GID complex subunit containing RING finger motif [Chaenotheca gracillima]